MATIINASIDVTKIDRTKLIKDKYLNVSIIVDDKNDKFGNNVSITLSQSSEERAAKAPKTYMGNGKVVWGVGKLDVATNVGTNVITSEDSSLPF
jgi:hypothetical protein